MKRLAVMSCLVVAIFPALAAAAPGPVQNATGYANFSVPLDKEDRCRAAWDHLASVLKSKGIAAGPLVITDLLGPVAPGNKRDPKNLRWAKGSFGVALNDPATIGQVVIALNDFVKALKALGCSTAGTGICINLEAKAGP